MYFRIYIFRLLLDIFVIFDDIFIDTRMTIANAKTYQAPKFQYNSIETPGGNEVPDDIEIQNPMLYFIKENKSNLPVIFKKKFNLNKSKNRTKNKQKKSHKKKARRSKKKKNTGKKFIKTVKFNQGDYSDISGKRQPKDEDRLYKPFDVIVHIKM